jgi:very-short-patch-repair endonuclease
VSDQSKNNPSQPPLVRGGAERLAEDRTARNIKVRSNSSPDKGRPGGVNGFIPYDKRLTALARENRKNPTLPEIKMWNEVLRMRHFADHKFLRQKPIADFIVDFYCAELRLAIEIDGDSHAESAEYDAGRTEVLNEFGISVARYTNFEVMNNLEGVYDDLLRRVMLVGR